MNPSNTWKGKLEAASFFASKNLYKQCDDDAHTAAEILSMFLPSIWLTTEFSYYGLVANAL